MAKKKKFYVTINKTSYVLTETRFPFIWNWLNVNIEKINVDYTELQTRNKLAQFGMVTKAFTPKYELGSDAWKELSREIKEDVKEVRISYTSPNKVYCYLKQLKN